MSRYRVYVRQIIYGSGEVEANSEDEAIQKAAEEYDSIDWEYGDEEDEVDFAELIEEEKNEER
jgi:hypothetical protein